MSPGFLIGAVLCAPPALAAADLPAPTHREAVARFGTAVWNLRRERLLTAVKQLEDAARQDPDATAPLRELVRVYSQVGREPDAIRVARQVLARDPHDVDVAHALARLLFDAGDLKEAVAAAKLAAAAPITLERADKAVAVYRDLATLCEKASETATAEIALGKAVELVVEKRKEVIDAGAFTPREADAAAAECLERLGKVQTKRQKYADATRAFEAAAKLYADPLRANDSGAAARLGWNLSGVLQARGEPGAALEHLTSFLKLRPISPEPYARLVKLLRETGRDGQVVLTLIKYVESDPRNLPLQAVYAAELAREPSTRPDSEKLFASVMAETNDPKVVEVIVRSRLETDHPGEIVADLDRSFGKLKEAEKEEKSVETPEKSAAKAFAAAKARAIAEILKGDREATTAVLRAAADDLQTGTKRAHQTYYFLAQLAARHRKLELAALQFRQATRNAPKETQADAYQGLIDVLWMAGKPAEVVTACRDALQNAETLSPHYLNYHLALALAELGDAPGALTAVDKAIQQTADSDRLVVRLQKVHVLQILGKWDDAIAFAKKLLVEFDGPSDRQSIRYSLASAYWGAGKRAEAETELRAILDVEPDNAPASNDLGFHLADQGRDLDEAERLIRNAIAADRHDRKKSGVAELENAAYLDSLGWVLFRRGKLPEGRIELERAATLPGGASDPVVWDHLGDVLFRIGEKARAKTAWETAVELYENDGRGSSRGRNGGRLDEVKRKLKRIP